MREGVALAKQVGNVHAKCHFDALQSIRCHQSKLLVEQIQRNGIAEMRVRQEGVGSDVGDVAALRVLSKLPSSKGIPVGTQSVVADPFEIGQRCGVIAHVHAARFQ